ncbi:MAG: hypothetical protein US94_C0004G0004 [Berkelbacteria bacterium GW2011_GWB1_38_5]|uniref:Uncharacterized protein n=2 Tax=Candidatus Berkelbacteria TaxID=1618330 RepID=A0A0G0LFS3_9BACT|nr:MAG: hypothetical protein US94_C0004G0004 [Berkelbacteria bacterium GW2011_GWB1_38_5]KKQ90703.1 MAG: hypothetical protein UT15_C0006G0004 [Berkelbacteria bacterium GW2011_GWA1_39_10]
MRQSWKDYEEAADKGPVALGWKILGAIVLFVIVISVIGWAMGWFSEAAKVTQEQFGPSALLKKYEWFKDVSAQLDKKRADIKVYDGRMTAMESSYKGKSRGQWPREDREQYNVWSSEAAGVKASYNELAAQYNAQMAKFNWRFANKGQLPEGASEPLPREYKTYTEN